MTVSRDHGGRRLKTTFHTPQLATIGNPNLLVLRPKRSHGRNVMADLLGDLLEALLADTTAL